MTSVTRSGSSCPRNLRSSEASTVKVCQIKLLPILYVKSEPGFGKAGLRHLSQRFPGGALLQTDGGSIRSYRDLYGVPIRLRHALLAGEDFRAFRFRDAHGLKTAVSDFALDIVFLIHVVQEPLGGGLSPLPANCKLDRTERLPEENESGDVSCWVAILGGPDPLAPV